MTDSRKPSAAQCRLANARAKARQARAVAYAAADTAFAAACASAAREYAAVPAVVVAELTRQAEADEEAARAYAFVSSRWKSNRR